MTTKQILIFIFLLVSGMILFVSYNQRYETSFTTLSSEIELQSSGKEGEILEKGDIITADFTANYNNLGQVVIRFFNFNRDSNDLLEFRLKESDANEWLYKATHKTDQFLPDKLFPFGFPIIQDSANEEYHIEVESLKGSTESGIALSKIVPQAEARYSFNKTSLMSRPLNLVYFLYNKLRDIASNSTLRYSLFLYSLPAIYYLILTRSGSLYLLPLSVIAFFLVYQISSPDINHSFQYFLIPFMWTILCIKHFLDYKVTVYFTAVLILIGVYNLLKVRPDFAEIFILWGYVFLFASFAMLLLIQKRLYVNKVSPKELLVSLREQYIFVLENIKKFDPFLIRSTNHDLVVSLFKVIILFVLIMGTGLLAHNSFLGLNAMRDIYAEYYQSNSLLFFLRYNVVKLATLYSLSIFIGIRTFKYFTSYIPAVLVAVTIISLFQNSLIGMDKAMIQQPKIISVSPNSTSEAWTDITIRGSNFKNIPFIGKVLLKEIDQYLLISWSDKEVVFRTNPDTSLTGKLKILTSDGKLSNEVDFTYEFAY